MSHRSYFPNATNDGLRGRLKLDDSREVIGRSQPFAYGHVGLHPTTVDIILAFMIERIH